MKVALIHDWLVGVRGGERVLDAMLEVLQTEGHTVVGHTLIRALQSSLPRLNSIPWRTSPLQRVPHIETGYRQFLPLMPWAIEQFDLSEFDAIVSSSHCVAKGVLNPRQVPHWSYVHAPMRYMWDRFDDYFGPGRQRFLARRVAQWIRPHLQAWDRQSADPKKVSRMVANSTFVAEQVHRHYGRDAEVIHPFVDLERFEYRTNAAENFYLMVGAFAPNKRVDLAIEASKRFRFPLWIVGDGQDRRRLEALAQGSPVRFLGSRSDREIADLYRRTKAFIFPGVEDFGITPLEAMASGAPVVAYGQGGVLDSVTSETGVLFLSQTVEALWDSIEKIERQAVVFDVSKLRHRAEEFSRSNFLNQMTISIRNAQIR